MVQGKGTGRKIFINANYFLCALTAIACILPVIHILAISLSSKQAVFSGHVTFWPVETTLDSYRVVVRDMQFFVSYWVSIKRAGLGWLIQLTMTVLAAYPLCLKKSTFPARQYFVWYFLITIFFNGGLIPTYLVVKGTGLIDHIWALLLPGAVPVFNIILMKNFMKGIPDSLMESAFIDGSGHFITLIKIMIPLSKACIATVSLFCILGHWNAWFDGMIYISSMSLKPLQTYLRSVIIVNDYVAEGYTSSYLQDIIDNVTSDSSNGAKIFLALIPIMCIYPFLQKHFAKGIVVGSVKG
ncbi:MAG: carbohydrate ABC transporter permease [Bacillota bacterium]|nr:carbohydrate ABC transporter permease [Bacillota bacterium]